MAYPTDRVILHDRAGNLLPELSPEQVLSRVRTEEVNGEHALVIVTTRRMEEGWRALTVDSSGRWREWVLTEPDEAHENGDTAIGTYRFVWSLQYDLTTSYSHTESEPGMGSACTSHYALEKALEGVSNWEAGPCDAPPIEAGKGCVLIYESAWSRLSKVVEVTGGEVDALITVSNLYGVTSRKVTLNAHVGSTEPTRRFDWGYDVISIHRIPDPGPYYCRIVPLGRGEQEYAEDDETTFEWPLDITDETGDPGLFYIQDDEAAAAFRVPDGQGGWLYPTKVVSYSEDDPELLLNAATEDLHNHTRPGVTYEANVMQFAAAGMDVDGVSLGDDVHIVDRGFSPDAPLRLQGRVTRVEIDELSPETDTQLTIGTIRNGIAATFTNALSELAAQTTSLSNSVAHLNTQKYLQSLLERINAEIAATGGYAYLVPGEGVITYNAAVSDPLVGTEASQVVQIKGGSIRIASSKNVPFAGINDWQWKTVFTSGHVAAEVITAIEVVAGYIGSSASGAYWDIDNGSLQVRDGNGTLVARFDQSGAVIAGDVTMRSVTSNGSVNVRSLVDIGEIVTTDSSRYWNLTGGNSGGIERTLTGLKAASYAESSGNLWGSMMLIPNASGSSYWNTLVSNRSLMLMSNDGADSSNCWILLRNNTAIDMGVCRDPTSSGGRVHITSTGMSVGMNFTVSGTKSRQAGTKGFGDRLLYCYETAAPYFGDIGSGRTDEDGECYVELDERLVETLRADLAYQVFLQPCGSGTLYVAEKRPGWFVVKGTPNLAFDWEMKARQTGYEAERLESPELRDDAEESGIPDLAVEDAYGDELEMASSYESLYEEEIA